MRHRCRGPHHRQARARQRKTHGMSSLSPGQPANGCATMQFVSQWLTIPLHIFMILGPSWLLSLRSVAKSSSGSGQAAAAARARWCDPASRPAATPRKHVRTSSLQPRRSVFLAGKVPNKHAARVLTPRRELLRCIVALLRCCDERLEPTPMRCGPPRSCRAHTPVRQCAEQPCQAGSAPSRVLRRNSARCGLVRARSLACAAAAAALAPPAAQPGDGRLTGFTKPVHTQTIHTAKIITQEGNIEEQ